MSGTAEVRYCSHCSRSVHNLSAMTRREAERLVAESNGRLCVRYVRLPDGRIATETPPLFALVRRSSRLVAGAATLALVSLAADASAGPRRPYAATHQTAIRDGEPAEQKEGRGSASGRVLDPSGATIDTGDVTLTNMDTKEAVDAVTDENGAFRVDDLAAGVYELIASSPGFAHSYPAYLTVRAGHDASCELALGIGSLGEIVISSEAEQLVEHQSERSGAPEPENAAEDGSDDAASLLDAAGDDLDEVKQALETATDVDVRDRFGDTPLMLAAKGNDPRIVKLLVAAGADVNARNAFGVTPLMYAALGEDPAITKMLLKAGADPNAADQDGRTALMFAALEGSLKTVKALVSADADANATDLTGRRVLLYAEEGDHRAVRRFLTAAGAR